MKFVKLEEREFDNFASKHPYSSFYQTSSWGHLKEANGWNMHLLGVKDGNKVIAASLLLSKKTPIGYYMFYAPRGFLIDYDNMKLLEFFTENIKKYAKDKKGIFIKIDPYISYQERDINGNVVKDGKNNKNAFNNLVKLGYKHFGFNIMQDTLQPRWMFVTDTKGETVDSIMKKMDPKTRQILHKCERLGIYTREIGFNELPKFKDIMEKTGERREFIDRPLSYYEEMFKHLHDKGILKILVAEINIKDLVRRTDNDITKLKNEIEDRTYKHDNNIIKMNEAKYESKQNEAKKEIERLEANLVKYKNLLESDGEIITLGGILFLINDNEVLSLVGGSYAKYMEFQSAYAVHFSGMKYAIEHGYDRYNFYGIVGDFNEKNELGGLYTFKKSFSGYVVELIGEFDLILNKPLYYLYHIAFGIYHFVKNLKAKINKKNG